jgi:Predicted N6-adenine-specific DNA methylase
VDACIRFKRADVRDLDVAALDEEHGMIITNPPYGERIGEQEEINGVFKALRSFMKEHPGWSLFIITPDKEAEKKIMGRRANRRRKLYNGNIETTYYQFHGEKK